MPVSGLRIFWRKGLLIGRQENLETNISCSGDLKEQEDFFIRKNWIKS